MSKPGREVNFSEELKIDLEDSTSENEEEIEDTTKEPEEKSETETPAESSPAKEQTTEEIEDSSKSEEEAVVEKEPKPVEGETPRERGLRLENEKLRARLRDERTKKVIPDEQGTPVVLSRESERFKKLKEKFSEDDLTNLQEVFTAFSEDLGFVRKDQFSQTTYQQQASTVLEDFLEKNSQYLPENDPDNILWTQFQEEMKFYRRPDNPRDYKKIFERVHQSIFGIQSSVKLDKINAQKAKIKTASHTATPQSHTEKPEERKRPVVNKDVARQFMKGFSEEELKELGI